MTLFAPTSLADVADPLGEITAFLHRLHAVPFESFSRFTRERPGYLMPEDMLRHIDEGGGVGCFEKALFLAQHLRGLGLEAEVLSAGYEWWLNGANMVKHKGTASRPLAEVEAKIAPFFAPDRPTSAYEVPAHLSHWANWFRLAGTEYLVDVTGRVMPFRLFAGAEVADLLDRRPKAYLEYSYQQFHLYYHRVPVPLWERLLAKTTLDSSYVLGRILGSPIAIHENVVLQLRWWWRDGAMEEEHAALARQVEANRGQAVVTFVAGLDEVRAMAPRLLSPSQWEVAYVGWPAMQRCLAEVFDAPPHVRFAVTRSLRPLHEYSPMIITCPEPRA